MKLLAKYILVLLLASGAMLYAAPLQIHEMGSLPKQCEVIGDVKVGDIAGGYRSRADVVSEMKREAQALGGNYVLIDVQRVNNPKQGIYYWAWGTVGNCK